MPRVEFLPTHQSIQIETTTTLREAAHLAGVDVFDRCGGLGACCNCVVKVLNGMDHLNPKTWVEEAVHHLGENERLSCQCRILGEAIVTLTVPV
jgi:ferredoxin